MSLLQTREASTLVIATVLASASLLLLTVPLDNGSIAKQLSLSLPDIATIGFLFAVLGLVYRQVTVWTIDRKEHNRDPERYVKRNRRDEYYVYAGIRGFVLLFFLSIPIAFWEPEALEPLWTYLHLQIPDWCGLSNITSTHCTILFSTSIALILTGSDLFLRLYDKHYHKIEK